MEQNKPFKDNRKRNSFIGIVLIVGGILAGYWLISTANDVMFLTGLIMQNIPNDCYVYYPLQSDHSDSSAQIIYYQSMVDKLNQTGVKYIGPFLRSPAFTLYLFQHCPFLNTTNTSILKYQTFNSTIGQSNTVIHPSSWLLQQEKEEQEIHDYNLAANSKSYSRIEYAAVAFNQTLPQIIDELFLNNAVNIDLCKNPSWRANSVIRECSWQQSHFVVNLHTMDLMAIADPPIVGMNFTKS